MIHVNDKLKEMKVENGQPEHIISNDKMNNENAHTVIKKKIEHRLHTNTYDYNIHLSLYIIHSTLHHQLLFVV